MLKPLKQKDIKFNRFHKIKKELEFFVPNSFDLKWVFIAEAFWEKRQQKEPQIQTSIENSRNYYECTPLSTKDIIPHISSSNNKIQINRKMMSPDNNENNYLLKSMRI